MSDAIRVLVEAGKKKRTVAVAFDRPGWDRSAKTEAGALEVLAMYPPRYAKVAVLAGLAAEFDATGEPEVVERLEGTGMTDFYGLSMRSALPEFERMSDALTSRPDLRRRWEDRCVDQGADGRLVDTGRAPRSG